MYILSLISYAYLKLTRQYNYLLNILLKCYLNNKQYTFNNNGNEGEDFFNKKWWEDLTAEADIFFGLNHG